METAAEKGQVKVTQREPKRGRVWGVGWRSGERNRMGRDRDGRETMKEGRERERELRAKGERDRVRGYGGGGAGGGEDAVEWRRA